MILTAPVCLILKSFKFTYKDQVEARAAAVLLQHFTDERARMYKVTGIDYFYLEFGDVDEVKSALHLLRTFQVDFEATNDCHIIKVNRRGPLDGHALLARLLRGREVTPPTPPAGEPARTFCKCDGCQYVRATANQKHALAMKWAEECKEEEDKRWTEKVTSDIRLLDYDTEPRHAERVEKAKSNIKLETRVGRFSSKEPNLQNIPLRTEAGRQIREVLVGDQPIMGVDFADVEKRIVAQSSSLLDEYVTINKPAEKKHAKKKPLVGRWVVAFVEGKPLALEIVSTGGYPITTIDRHTNKRFNLFESDVLVVRETATGAEEHIEHLKRLRRYE